MKRAMVAATALWALALLAGCGGDADKDSGSAASTPAGGTTGAASSATTAASGGDGSAAIAALKQPPELADGAALGKKTAKATLVLFEDFQCPFCLRFTVTYDAMLIDEYVKTGKLRLEFKNFPILGVESAQAALGAQCAADKGQFWPYHNRLFLEQAKAGQLAKEQLNVGRFSIDNLVKFATDLGLDGTAFAACIGSADTTAKVTADFRAAQDLGLRSTPSLVLNGKPVAIPASAGEFRKLLDDAIAGK